MSSVNKKHGYYGTRTYRIWQGIVTRCYNKKDPAYKWYGGRGIKMQESWRRFEGFLKDIGEVPFALSVDRVDSDGDYEAGNVRLATTIEQNNNKRNNHYLLLSGQRYTIAQASRAFGTSASKISNRKRAGWTDHEAVYGRS